MLNAAEFSSGSLLLLTSSKLKPCCGRGAGSAGRVTLKLERGGAPALERIVLLGVADSGRGAADSERAVVACAWSGVDEATAPGSQHDAVTFELAQPAMQRLAT